MSKIPQENNLASAAVMGVLAKTLGMWQLTVNRAEVRNFGPSKRLAGFYGVMRFSGVGRTFSLGRPEGVVCLQMQNLTISATQVLYYPYCYYCHVKMGRRLVILSDM